MEQPEKVSSMVKSVGFSLIKMVTEGNLLTTPQNPLAGDIKPALHPAYTASNIQNKICTLDGTDTIYSSWVKLFKLHSKAYKVLDHIDDTPGPDADDPSFPQWAEIDALVLQWIYSTISKDLLSRTLEDDSTAYQAWTKIYDIFMCNKQSRAATLEHEFRNTTLAGCGNLDEYCKNHKEIAGQLGDLDQPVSVTRLVMQMVRGLSVELDTIGTIINNSCPTWDEARQMVQKEQQRLGLFKKLAARGSKIARKKLGSKNLDSK
ncbi:uncharacterized protein LOC143533762 [Bidens hawaiensis]|uniref:uncharacterized protein LOC143533762 n=1 Tax=Bidens hawaiensis TaxID=980011 RepID=UPI004049BF27